MSHGWFLTVAVMFPVTPLPTMMVLPMNAAKPAITSEIFALSHDTVMGGWEDCWVAEAAGAADGSRGAAASAYLARSLAQLPSPEDQAANARSVPNDTVTAPLAYST